MIEAALAALATEPVPADAPRDVVRLSLLDWIACAQAGRVERVAVGVRALVAAEGWGPSALIGGVGAPPRGAALANGAAGHALDYDDTHFDHIGHPTAAVAPAVLALAEVEGLDGAALIDALLVGTEASVRIGVWLGRAHYDAGFHQTATAGALGAAMGCARVLGLDEGGARRALGLAATRASGLKSQFGTDGKPLNAGIAAANGVEAARLAALGLTAPEAPLSGPQGFGPSHSGQGIDPGGAWRMGRVSHKLHACCHGLHAMLEVLRTLPAGDGPVEIAAHPRWRAVCAQEAPTTGLGAKFSFRTAAGIALAGHDTADPAVWSDAAATDPGVVRHRDRVTLRWDDALAETAARVRIGDAEAAHDLTDPVPFEETRARVEGKAELLVGPLAGAVRDALRAGDAPTLFAALRA